MADRIDSTREIDGHSQMGEGVRDHDDAAREGRACRVRDHDDATREGRACRVRAPAPVHTGGTRSVASAPPRQSTREGRACRVRTPAPVHTGGTRSVASAPTPGRAGARPSRPRRVALWSLPPRRPRTDASLHDDAEPKTELQQNATILNLKPIASRRRKRNRPC